MEYQNFKLEIDEQGISSVYCQPAGEDERFK